MLSCLAGTAERRQPLRLSINQSLCLALAFHNPHVLIRPDSTVTFADSKFTPWAHPAPGVSLCTGEGKAPIAARLHAVRGRPPPRNASATASVPLMPCQPLAQWLLINPEPPGTERGPACQTHLGRHPQSFIMMCLFAEELNVPFERRIKWPGQKSWGTALQVPRGLQRGCCTGWACRTGSQVVKGPFCPSDGCQTACVFPVTRPQLGGFSAHLYRAHWKNQTQPMLPIASSFVTQPRAVLRCLYLLNVNRSRCSLAVS